jgi:hypothetical protein
VREMSSARWYFEEYRNLILTTLLAAIVLGAVYVLLGPYSADRQAKRREQFLADCRARYAGAQTLADTSRVDVWPSSGPFEGRKMPERNDLFTCGASRRRGEL